MFAVVLAALVAMVLSLVAGLHVYWAAGGQWAASAVVPTQQTPGPQERRSGAPLFQPGPAATLAVAVALGGATLLVLGRVGAIPRIGPAWAYRYGVSALGAVFLLRTVGEFRYVGVFKRVRGTPYAARDTWLYTPLCAGLAAAVLYLAAI